MPRELSPAAKAEVQRILDREARRILRQRLTVNEGPDAAATARGVTHQEESDEYQQA